MLDVERTLELLRAASGDNASATLPADLIGPLLAEVDVMRAQHATLISEVMAAREDRCRHHKLREMVVRQAVVLECVDYRAEPDGTFYWSAVAVTPGGRRHPVRWRSGSAKTGRATADLFDSYLKSCETT